MSAESDVAYRLYEAVTRDIQDLFRYGLRVGEALSKLKEGELYKVLGYSSMTELCADVGISRTTAHMMQRAAYVISELSQREEWREYAEPLAEIGTQKLWLLSRALDAGVMTRQLLEQAQVLAYRDLRVVIKELIEGPDESGEREVTDEIVDYLRGAATRIRHHGPEEVVRELREVVSRAKMWMDQLGGSE